MNDSKMDAQKTTSKTSMLNNMILRAWRERWSESQFGIKIKGVLPRGVSGDVYNLADCILQQALVGSTANALILSYLKHSVLTYMVSYAAVLRRISKYEHYERVNCVTALLELLKSIIDGVTCRNKAEESILPSAVVSLVNWLFQVFAMIVKHFEINGEISAEQSVMLDHTCIVIDALIKNDFIIGILYIGRQEDPECYLKIRDKYLNIKTSLANANFTPQNPLIEQYLHQLANIDVQHLGMQKFESEKVETMTYCVQPLLVVEELLNPCNDTNYYVTELQMIQRLKKFSNKRLYYEIIRAALMSLSSVAEANPNHDNTMWSAFTFFKVMHIIKQLNAISNLTAAQTPIDHIPDVVAAFELLLDDNALLDLMDVSFNCNIIEYLLNDWTKHQLVNEMHLKHFVAQRDPISKLLQKNDTGNHGPSIITFILRAEVPLAGILKTLSADFHKVEEALYGVLSQVVVGNSFELILSTAASDGRLKLFVSRLIACNEKCIQIPGEVSKPARATLFDTTFLMLAFIVQTYGSHVCLPENGDSFFEKWVRDCMVEHNKPKDPSKMVALCDPSIVDELILMFSKPEAHMKASSLTWQDICLNLPGVIHEFLLAWESETISSADVKNILDNMKRRQFSFSVCAATYLCAHIFKYQDIKYLLKPLNMIQQFLTPPSNDEMLSQENAKDRLGLAFQIIRKMQQEVQPPRSSSLNPLVSACLEVQFKSIWNVVATRGWLPVRTAQALETILEAGGPEWLATQLVEEILKCKYTKDMMKTMDIAFAILHLDIERTTEALLTQVITQIVQKRQGDDVNEPQLLVLARLCVYCIISSFETRQRNAAQIKRTRSHDTDEFDTTNNAKMRKMGADGSDNSCSNDFINDGHLGIGNTTRETPVMLKEPLQSSIQCFFQEFQSFLNTEEISPKISFIHQFLSLLVECGQERVLPILKLLPINLVQSLLKIMLGEGIGVGFVCRLYDLHANSSRQTAISDLCLLRNIQLKRDDRCTLIKLPYTF